MWSTGTVRYSIYCGRRFLWTSGWKPSELLKRPDEPMAAQGRCGKRVRDRPQAIRYARWLSQRPPCVCRIPSWRTRVARLRARRQLATDFQRRGRYQHPVPHLAAGGFRRPGHADSAIEGTSAAINLEPYKMAVITSLSGEILRQQRSDRASSVGCSTTLARHSMRRCFPTRPP